MGLTDAQLLDRKAYIGGSDAPALAGVNPPRWSQPIDVYLDKVGQAPKRPTSKVMALGSLMEDLVFGLATEATGITWRRAGRSVRSRVYPWAGGHVDRYGVDPSGVPVVGEAKWSMSKEGWGPSWQAVDANGDPVAGDVAVDYLAPEGGAVIPPHYVVQVQHYLAVTGRPVAIVVALLGYADFRWYVLPRNDDMISTLMQVEERFWTEHVVPRVPPAPDGSDGYAAHLRAKYATDNGLERVATPELTALATELGAARAGREEYARIEATFQQQLMDAMGDTAKVVGDGWSVTWRQNRPTVKVEWEDLATDLLHQAYPDADPMPGVTGAELPQQWPTTKKARAELIRAVARASGYATEEPGARPFRVEFDEPQEAPDAS